MNTNELPIASHLMVGFPGTSVTPHLERLIRQGLLGVVLFRRNIESAEQTADLIATLRGISRRPLLVAVDQEGGRVARLRGHPFTELPPMRSVGELQSEEHAHALGQLLAHELRAVGFNWNFAPVLDVDTNPANPVIGDRAFHRDPAVVSRLGIALARGLEEGGVASCGKHFPGHGDTVQDSHVSLPRLPHDLARLRRIELPPFAAYANAKLASIMTAHVVFDAVDPGVPATLSPLAIRLLRDELGFSGLIVSDDLEMKAIAGHSPIGDAALRTIEAGVDVVLVCSSETAQDEALAALSQRQRASTEMAAAQRASHHRIETFRQRFGAMNPTGLATLSEKNHLARSQRLTATALHGLDPTERPA